MIFRKGTIMNYCGRLIASALLFALSLLSPPTSRAQIDVLTQHNDNARSGLNRQETKLTTKNVNKTQFGKLCFRLVDGNPYAQPLIVSAARAKDRTIATNILLVSTEHNSVFAFDAEDTDQNSTHAQIWQTGPDVLGQSILSEDLSQVLSGSRGDCVDLTTEIGITGTPVVALTKATPPKEGVIFVVAKSMKGTAAPVQNLFALSLFDGKPLGPPTSIQGDFKVPGAATTIDFDAMIQLNRPALLLEGNTLYIAFGGHCDRKNFRGWLFAYDVSDPKTPLRRDVFCTTPGNATAAGHHGGIWMSGQGPSVDASGNIYLSVGDGSYVPGTDFGDSVVKLKLVGGKLQVQDWFTPQNQKLLDDKDVDLGSAGAVLLPDSHLLVAGGKEGRMFLIDRDDMGKGVKTSLHSLQVTNPPFPAPPNSPRTFWNIHGSPVVWNLPERRGVKPRFLCTSAARKTT